MAALLYGLTIFLGAFLLFLVQPMIGRFVLPWFGGGPGVWTVCLLFFQTLLLGGYAYAHGLATWCRPRTQAALHLGVLGLALAFLPIVPHMGRPPAESAEPTGQLLWLLAATVGAPYFALSATAPLLQRWFCHTQSSAPAYRLYALSNAGG